LACLQTLTREIGYLVDEIANLAEGTERPRMDVLAGSSATGCLSIAERSRASGRRRAKGTVPKTARPTEKSYRTKDTTIATVSKAIVAIKTLWPQRAIIPSMFNLPVTSRKTPQLGNSCSFAALIWAQFVTVQPRWM